MDEKILSYNDVVLRRSDLDILDGPYFLNDRIIEFYFGYLSTLFPSKDIYLVPPSIAFWIKECPKKFDLKDFVEPLKLSEKDLILFPINDNTDVAAAEGGSHWSLLVFERKSNMFIHHDSGGKNMNRLHAFWVYNAVCPYTKSNPEYKECDDTPRQLNGYDCGLYVTAIARAICEWYARDDDTKDMKDLWFSEVKQKVTPLLVSDMRGEILDFVKTMMAKQ